MASLRNKPKTNSIVYLRLIRKDFVIWNRLIWIQLTKNMFPIWLQMQEEEVNDKPPHILV